MMNLRNLNRVINLGTTNGMGYYEDLQSNFHHSYLYNLDHADIDILFILMQHNEGLFRLLAKDMPKIINNKNIAITFNRNKNQKLWLQELVINKKCTKFVLRFHEFSFIQVSSMVCSMIEFLKLNVTISKFFYHEYDVKCEFDINSGGWLFKILQTNNTRNINNITKYERLSKVEELEYQVLHWKANHDNVMNKLRLFTQRKDLPVDRLPAYKYVIKLEKENKELRDELQQLKSNC